MDKRRPKVWGDEFQRHVSNGCDHADAAFRADEWLLHRKMRRAVGSVSEAQTDDGRDS